ncbi:MAG: Ig-like domain repeat protein [Solobacterium sp.]|nr:Ig-like domain repeat protein [Solobacterium sp.]
MKGSKKENSIAKRFLSLAVAFSIAAQPALSTFTSVYAEDAEEEPVTETVDEAEEVTEEETVPEETAVPEEPVEEEETPVIEETAEPVIEEEVIPAVEETEEPVIEVTEEPVAEETEETVVTEKANALEDIEITSYTVDPQAADDKTVTTTGSQVTVRVSVANAEGYTCSFDPSENENITYSYDEESSVFTVTITGDVDALTDVVLTFSDEESDVDITAKITDHLTKVTFETEEPGDTDAPVIENGNSDESGELVTNKDYTLRFKTGEEVTGAKLSYTLDGSQMEADLSFVNGEDGVWTAEHVLETAGVYSGFALTGGQDAAGNPADVSGYATYSSITIDRDAPVITNANSDETGTLAVNEAYTLRFAASEDVTGLKLSYKRNDKKISKPVELAFTKNEETGEYTAEHTLALETGKKTDYSDFRLSEGKDAAGNPADLTQYTTFDKVTVNDAKVEVTDPDHSAEYYQENEVLETTKPVTIRFKASQMINNLKAEYKVNNETTVTKDLTFEYNNRNQDYRASLKFTDYAVYSDIRLIDNEASTDDNYIIDISSYHTYKIIDISNPMFANLKNPNEENDEFSSADITEKTIQIESNKYISGLKLTWTENGEDKASTLKFSRKYTNAGSYYYLAEYTFKKAKGKSLTVSDIGFDASKVTGQHDEQITVDTSRYQTYSKIILDKEAPVIKYTSALADGTDVAEGSKVIAAREKIEYTISVKDDGCGIEKDAESGEYPIYYYVTTDELTGNEKPAEAVNASAEYIPEDGEFKFTVTTGSYGTVYVWAKDILENSSLKPVKTNVIENIAPEIKILVDNTEVSDEGESIPANNRFTVDLDIKDGPFAEITENGETIKDYIGSELNTVEYSLKKSDGTVISSETVLNNKKPGDDITQYTGEFAASFKIEDLIGENIIEDTLTLTVTATDFAGNQSEKEIRLEFDNKAPELTVEYLQTPYTSEKIDEQGRLYYNTGAEVVFTLNDDKTMQKYTVQHLVNGEATEVETDKVTVTDKEFAFSIEAASYKDSDVHTFVVYGTDEVGNPLTIRESTPEATNDDLSWEEDELQKTECGDEENAYTTKNGVIVDLTAPVVIVSYSEVPYTIEGDDNGRKLYYGSKTDSITVDFKFIETNPETKEDTKAYAVEELLDGNSNTVNYYGDADESCFTVKGDAGTETLKHNYRVWGVDKAGNPLKVVERTPAESISEITKEECADAENAFTTVNAVIHDVVAPTYSMYIKNVANEYGSENCNNEYYAYYNKQISASATITEKNFDSSRIGMSYVTGSKGLVHNAKFKYSTPANGENFSGTKTYKVSVTENGTYKFTIKGEDKAGNKLVQSAKEASKEPAYQKTVQAGTGKYWTSVKVIDKVIDGEIYVDENKGSKDPYLTVSSIKQNNLSVTKVFHDVDKSYVTVNALDEKSPYQVTYTIKSEGGKDLTKTLNNDGFADGNDLKDLEIKGEQKFIINDVTITDRAGNKAKVSLAKHPVYLDKTPSKTDITSPATSIKAETRLTRRNDDGRDLFNKSVDLTLEVDDPRFKDTTISSGIDTVTCVVTVDGKQVGESFTVSGYSTGNEKGGSNFKRTITIPSGTYETNDITVTLEATDRSGNKSNKSVYNFGIDTVGPTVTVSFDNNDAKNSKYFKANRTATIVVTDRNIDNSKINIKTEAGVPGSFTYSAGTGNGANDTWTKTVTYSADGDYTLEVTGTDALGNAFSQPVTYNGTAPRAFTIDKTVPVITLSFDGTPHTQNYYNQTRTGTITIVEHNFNGSEVVVRSKDGSKSYTVGFSTGSDTHVGSQAFETDGHYDMRVEYTDLAGNVAEVKEEDEFVIDKTPPKLSVEFSPADPFSTDNAGINYFNQTRVASITITEINFSESDVITTTLDGENLGPVSFSSGSDVHSGEIAYVGNGTYNLRVTYTDLAGNTVENEFTESDFIIDMDKPVITITADSDSGSSSLTDGYIYGPNDTVQPYIVLTDEHFFPENYTFSLTKTNADGSVEVVPITDSAADSGTNATLLITALGAVTKQNDGIYTLSVKVTDRAGNITEQSVDRFSVNRFGSTFAVVQKPTDYYEQNIDKTVQILEKSVVGVDPENVTITVYKNGNARELSSDEYTRSETRGTTGYDYTYTINDSVFAEEGRYNVVIQTVDRAGTINTSTAYVNETGSNESSIVEFVVDRTVPDFTVNLNDGKETKVNANNYNINVYPSDNMAVAAVTYTLDNGDEVVITGEELEKALKENGFVTHQVGEYLGNVTIRITDAAGNISEEKAYALTVSTNVFVRYRKEFMIGGGSGAALLLLLFLLLKRRKKNEEDQAA